MSNTKIKADISNISTNLDELKKQSVSLNSLKFGEEKLTAVLIKIQEADENVVIGAVSWRNENESFDYTVSSNGEVAVNPHQNEDDDSNYEDIVKILIQNCLKKTTEELEELELNKDKKVRNGKNNPKPLLKSFECQKETNRNLSENSILRLDQAVQRFVFPKEFVDFIKANSVYGIQCHGGAK
ncbi:hypothetical protein [Fluviispira sanaruensis]|uniref:Uncharacterized protein n=1 Tax=Fluviispira sanaruensis TaxID=2493639 RepID=A0A4P2VNZ3_FLUSA|nr:hypothetical protein [Fluviispira sanaruensis]BBH54678.1 hypothetical protein JCM31447_31520 [Fluviispira sanaruensis]